MKKLHTPILSTGFSEDGKKAKNRFENILSKNKKRSLVLIFALVTAIISVEVLISCSGKKLPTTEKENQTEVNQQQTEKNIKSGICAFIKEIKGDTIVVDVAEYITTKDTERIEELGLSFSDMPNGYYINNPETAFVEYTLTDKTVFNFIDWKNDFVEEGESRNVSSTSKEDFVKYLSTYQNSQPGMPFFFEISDKIVISITEEIMM